MSKANKYTFAETFSTNKHKLIYGISVVMLTVAGVIIMNIPFGNPEAAPGQMEQPGMNSQTNIEYNAEKTIDSNVDENNGNYSSNDSNKLAVLVTNEITSNLKNFTLNKTGNVDGGDNTSFYGTNAGILAKSGATLNIEGATVSNTTIIPKLNLQVIAI